MGVVALAHNHDLQIAHTAQLPGTSSQATGLVWFRNLLKTLPRSDDSPPLLTAAPAAPKQNGGRGLESGVWGIHLTGPPEHWFGRKGSAGAVIFLMIHLFPSTQLFISLNRMAYIPRFLY